MQHLSTSDWKGSQPNRFSPGRAHLTMQNSLGPGLQACHQSKPEGLRTFNFGATKEMQYMSGGLKTFGDKYISNQKQIDLRGKKALSIPRQVERKRPEMSHVKGGSQTNKQLEFKGLKTFSHANSLTTKNQYDLQNKLQRKTRILGLESSRNEIGISSLGDKAYKYPEYAPNFYQSGGLIPGSTQTYQKKAIQELTLDEKKLKFIFTKPNWNVKVKMDEEAQERQIIDSVDEWEKTILKENNPKYQDPDTFFERMEAGNAGGGGKDKKPGKK